MGDARKGPGGGKRERAQRLELEPEGDAPRNTPLAALRGLLGARVPLGEPTAAEPPDARDVTPASAAGAASAVSGRVSVRRERAGRGGKSVVVVEGPGLAAVDCEGLAREAARALGTGARTEEGTLVIQGDQAERVVAWLEGRGFGSVQRAN